MTSSTGRPTYVFEGFILDAQHRVLSRTGGEPILLAPKAFDTLLYFVEHRGELLDKRALLDAIWPNVVVEENNLNQCISTLRRVLGERPAEHRFIVTEPGRGYRFVAGVRVVADEASLIEKPAISESGVEPTSAPSVLARRRSPWFVVSAILVAFAIGLAWFWQSGSEVSPPAAASNSAGASPLPVSAREVLPNSVAVLPFHDASPDPSQAYIADGLHIDIISKLGQLGLNVINRNAVLKYSSSSRTAYSDIAAELRVQSILVGTIRYTDDEIRVDASLVDPATGLNLWNSEPYVGDLLNVFRAQADIATNVANRLNAEFSVAEQRRIETRPTVSSEALEAYFQASAVRSADRNEALRLFERATELDPNFAAAYGQLALLSARSLIDWVMSPVAVAADELQRQVLRNAAKALELDPRLAIAYAARGELHMYFWRWTEAESAFASAYELSRNEPDILLYYARFKTFRGEYDAALPMAQRLVELNPPAPNPDVSTGGGSLNSIWLTHVYSGHTEAAISSLNQELALTPRHITARLNLGYVEARRGNNEAAADAFEWFDTMTAGRRGATNSANLAHGYARVGRGEDAKRLFREVESMQDGQAQAAGTWAMAYLAIGDRGRALEWLDRAIEKIERHEPDAGWFSLMIIKHNLTGDPLLEEDDFSQRRTRIRGS